MGRFDDDEKRLEKENSFEDATTGEFLYEEVEKGEWLQVFESTDEDGKIHYTIAIPTALIDMNEEYFLKIADGVEKCKNHILKKKNTERSYGQ